MANVDWHKGEKYGFSNSCSTAGCRLTLSYQARSQVTAKVTITWLYLFIGHDGKLIAA
ncbi:hypothetical protein TUM4433_09460 [Shewanella schlegeliana]|nr:hypothetical protein TUM4433_09460 [Shewanella schlegeliana]